VLSHRPGDGHAVLLEEAEQLLARDLPPAAARADATKPAAVEPQAHRPRRDPDQPGNLPRAEHLLLLDPPHGLAPLLLAALHPGGVHLLDLRRRQGREPCAGVLLALLRLRVQAAQRHAVLFQETDEVLAGDAAVLRARDAVAMQPAGVEPPAHRLGR